MTICRLKQFWVALIISTSHTGHEEETFCYYNNVLIPKVILRQGLTLKVFSAHKANTVEPDKLIHKNYK